eukprot:55047_1
MANAMDFLYTTNNPSPLLSNIGLMEILCINGAAWIHIYSCLVLSDGFIWQIDSMVLLINFYVIFIFINGTIENSVADLIYFVHYLFTIHIVMAFIHIQYIPRKSGTLKILMVFAVSVVTTVLYKSLLHIKYLLLRSE